MEAVAIRFPHDALAKLRHRLLDDLQHEQFAMLLGKTHVCGEHVVVTVHEAKYPAPEDYRHQSLTAVSPKKDFVYRVLVEAQRRLDVDTVIDVHTHPFTEAAWFSGTDDNDERQFCRYLQETVGGMGYGSIVLSRAAYKARMWQVANNKPVQRRACLKTQTASEAVPEESPTEKVQEVSDLTHVQSRSALALGLDTLRRITAGQFVVLAGVGGLGSVMAEHLVHQGFGHIGLIDPDRLEASNLNRFVGAGHADAQENRLKVEVVAEHLKRINPDVTTEILAADVQSKDAEHMFARADWILVSTDNHSSRYAVQKAALQYFVPIISAGVNITVNNNAGNMQLVDRSGEIIVVRAGDGYCLNCLGRINHARVAAEIHPDPHVRDKTVANGYVQGLDVKEPAVKTLNSIIGSLAVECLVDQYRREATHEPIVIYESHNGPCLYPDRDSFERLELGCSACSNTS